MATLSLLSLIVIPLLLAPKASGYLTRHKPVGYVDNHLHGFRLHTNKVRAAKCLPKLRFTLAADELPAQGTLHRRNLRTTWKRYHFRATHRSSRCFTDQLWTWYRTSGAACVKSQEGAWTSNTGNGYYGGFQADMDFQRAYGAEYLKRKGTANNWLPIEQIHMAYRGWRARGWHPWPNTARECGLL